MEPNLIIDVSREAVEVLLKVALPPLLVALLIGVVISLIQALTQIQEATLSFVPKLVAIFLCLFLMLPFIASSLGDFSDHLFSMIVNIE
jgi:flagellar biosynthetic protein FliQ